MLELAGAINKKLGWATLLFDTRETEVSQFGRGAVKDVLGALTYVKNREHKYASMVNKVRAATDPHRVRPCGAPF